MFDNHRANDENVTWLPTRYIDIDGTAIPGDVTTSDGSANDVACIRIVSQTDGSGIILEGRPDNLLERAREILRTAELIVEQTKRSPDLLSLYGITTPVLHCSHDDEFVNADGKVECRGCGWVAQP